MSPAYPKRLAVKGPNARTVRSVKEYGAKHVAELGIYHGDTSLKIAEAVGTDGRLDLFDFRETVNKVALRLGAAGHQNFRTFANSHAFLDSYCWSLGKLLDAAQGPIWDYVFIDGAHTWAVDGFAFLLCDRLLRPGGLVDFDDYDWTLARSPSLRPSRFPLTAKLYTAEQIGTPQVALIVQRLVRPLGYVELVPKKLYRKPG